MADNGHRPDSCCSAGGGRRDRIFIWQAHQGPAANRLETHGRPELGLMIRHCGRRHLARVVWVAVTPPRQPYILIDLGPTHRNQPPA
jgi:hypothetical protein